MVSKFIKSCLTRDVCLETGSVCVGAARGEVDIAETLDLKVDNKNQIVNVIFE